MKIIWSDNIPTDTSSEHLWLDNLPNDRSTLQWVCDRLNRDLGNGHGPYYRVVEDNHVLFKWEP